MAKSKESVKKVAGDKEQIKALQKDVEDLKEAVASIRSRLVKQFGEG